MKMKKAVLRGPGQVEIVEMDAPQCPEGGVLVKVISCAVCGTDVENYLHGQRMSQLPPDLGHELTGEVTAVDSTVTHFGVGDRVALNQSVPCGECPDCENGYENLCDHTTRIGGGFGEYIAIPAVAVQSGNLLKMPDSLSYRAGTHAEALAAVINCSEIMDIKLGDTVLVVGAGAVGILHCQLAKAAGAIQVILSDVNQERLDSVLELSRADLTINSAEENLEECIKELTSGEGIDKIIVACSSGAAQEEAIKVVAKRGYVCMFGFTHKQWPWIKFDSNDCHYREFFVTGAFAYSRKQFKLALDLLASGAIQTDKLNTHMLPLERSVEALEAMNKGEGLKVLVEPSIQL
ncbi:MAG: alcohol dehydrogenase catalytic domain-containing protein [Desulfobacterales bacterium]|nr:alcohol dehydrogenase catalytic domain-containing protein [Desulfobacterales bacterium]